MNVFKQIVNFQMSYLNNNYLRQIIKVVLKNVKQLLQHYTKI